MSTLTFSAHMIFKSSGLCGTSHAERRAKTAQGDCKSKAVSRASFFEAKGIPFTLMVSPVRV